MNIEGKIVTVNSRKYNGEIHHTWKANLIEYDESSIVLVGAFDEEVIHSKLGLIRRGTISYEYYRLDSWYNIFRFHNPEGDLRNYYCNMNMPPIFSDGVLDYVDLDVDLLVSKDFKTELLDLDEFQENSIKFNYPAEINEQVHRAIKTLLTIIEKKSFPFSLTNTL